MNIYELEKQATQGPLTLEKVCDPYYGYELSHIDDANVGHHVAKVRGYFMDGGANNAALLAHCRNHFLEALEALKEEHSSNMGDGEYGFQHSRTDCKCCERIAKLENVEGV